MQPDARQGGRPADFNEVREAIALLEDADRLLDDRKALTDRRRAIVRNAIKESIRRLRI